MATVLVIDDEKDICQCFEDLLTTEEPGFKVLKADNGPDGLDLLKKHKPDIVFVDLQLQAAMDGIEVVKRIKQIDPTAKIVVVSGFIDDRDDETVKRMGVDSCLAKPATPDEIIRLVKKLLRQNKWGGDSNG